MVNPVSINNPCRAEEMGQMTDSRPANDCCQQEQCNETGETFTQFQANETDEEEKKKRLFQILKEIIKTQQEILQAIASGDEEGQQQAMGKLEKLKAEYSGLKESLGQNNHGKVQLPEAVSNEYKESLGKLTEEIIGSQADLISAVAAGDEELVQTAQEKLGTFKDLYSQTQEFVSAENPERFKLPKKTENSYKKSLRDIVERIASTEADVIQAAVSGDNALMKAADARLLTLKELFSLVKGFLGGN